MIRLRELRLQHGMNMKDTARALGLPYTTYVNYDKGIYEPSMETLVMFAKHYNVSVDYLIGKTDDPRTEVRQQADEDELQSYLDLLRARPEMKVLLDTVKGATKEEVEANVKFIEAMRGGKN